MAGQLGIVPSEIPDENGHSDSSFSNSASDDNDDQVNSDNPPNRYTDTRERHRRQHRSIHPHRVPRGEVVPTVVPHSHASFRFTRRPSQVSDK